MQSDGREMYRFWMGMLKSLGGIFDAATQDDTPRKDHEPRWRRSDLLRAPRPSTASKYRTDANGCCRRIVPKRDKSISSRQWKKRVKAARREAKAVSERG